MLTKRQQVLNETLSTRTRAEDMLRTLLEAKAVCEAHVAAANRTDPIKAVTGKSALDTAVASTRRMIEALDRAMDEARKALDEDDMGVLDEVEDESRLAGVR